MEKYLFECSYTWPGMLPGTNGAQSLKRPALAEIFTSTFSWWAQTYKGLRARPTGLITKEITDEKLVPDNEPKSIISWHSDTTGAKYSIDFDVVKKLPTHLNKLLTTAVPADGGAVGSFARGHVGYARSGSPGKFEVKKDAQARGCRCRKLRAWAM